jgi:hypothetical protein
MSSDKIKSFGFLIFLLVCLGVFMTRPNKDYTEKPKIVQTIEFLRYNDGDVIYSLTTSYLDVTHSDYGNAKEIDSLKCMRYVEMKGIVKTLDELNKSCEK